MVQAWYCFLVEMNIRSAIKVLDNPRRNQVHYRCHGKSIFHQLFAREQS